jgi:hypothetical protein
MQLSKEEHSAGLITPLTPLFSLLEGAAGGIVETVFSLTISFFSDSQTANKNNSRIIHCI